MTTSVVLSQRSESLICVLLRAAALSEVEGWRRSNPPAGEGDCFGGSTPPRSDTLRFVCNRATTVVPSCSLVAACPALFFRGIMARVFLPSRADRFLRWVCLPARLKSPADWPCQTAFKNLSGLVCSSPGPFCSSKQPPKQPLLSPFSADQFHENPARNPFIPHI